MAKHPRHRLLIPHRLLVMGGLALAVALLGAACGTEALSSRAFEERTLAMGDAQEMFKYGNDLLRAGRYKEALTAFTSAEQRAYTDELRAAARLRRMWLEQVVAALEQGRTPPLPPVVIRDSTLPPYSADLPAPAPEPKSEDDLPPLPTPPPSSSPSSSPSRGYNPGGFRETPLN